MVNEFVVKELKKKVYGLIEEVEEIGVVEDGMSIGEMIKKLKDVDGLVDKLIVNCFMGDDDD